METAGNHKEETNRMDTDVEASDVGLEAENGVPQNRPKDTDAMELRRALRSKRLLTIFILLFGLGASSAFLGLGIVTYNHDSNRDFNKQAEELAFTVSSVFREYELFGQWIVQSCVKSYVRTTDVSIQDDVAARLGFCTRDEFRNIYENIAAVGLDFQSAQLLPKVEHDEREAIESEAQEYYLENYDTVDYTGITETTTDPETGARVFVPRTEQPFYFPVHYVEPVLNNEAAIGLDSYSLRQQQPKKTMEARKPVLSGRLKLVQETDSNAYGIILQHPGLLRPDQELVAISQIVIKVVPFLEKITQGLAISTFSAYLFDSTESDVDPAFLGGVFAERTTTGARTRSLPETQLQNIPRSRKSRILSKRIEIADRTWTVAITSEAYQPSLFFVIFGFVVILLAVGLVLLWLRSHLNLMTKLIETRSQAEAEKSRAMEQQASHESLLNEYIAHEIRNPLSSAIAALSFVTSTVKDPALVSKATQQTLMQDLGVMNTALQFINELLRNLLDIHRSASKQIVLKKAPTDVSRDILEPVASILHTRRSSGVEIVTDCSPPDLMINADRMRLKQIMLNLSSNSTKFVNRGYIRLRASVVNDIVKLSVEDSGPGIPPAKRQHLFEKFQESLDSLNQGTGIGLSVCKNLSDLMEADIWLDQDFESGIEGCTGTRFVIRLNCPPMVVEEEKDGPDENQDLSPQFSIDGVGRKSKLHGNALDLPESQSVLFIDDDTVLRRMFTRALRRVAPDWQIHEASSGEVALDLVETTRYDIIFVDMYMASIEKQLLGTETVLAFRSKGVRSIVCGLSANDLESEFLKAGADAFMSKPFPCQEHALKRELLRILQIRHRQNDENMLHLE